MGWFIRHSDTSTPASTSAHAEESTDITAASERHAIWRHASRDIERAPRYLASDFTIDIVIKEVYDTHYLTIITKYMLS